MKKTILKTLTILSLLTGLNSFAQAYTFPFEIAGGSAQVAPTYTTSNVMMFGTAGIMRLANSVSITDGRDSSNSKLLVAGSFSFNGGITGKYLSKTTNYTVTATDYVVSDTTSGDTIKLPTSVGKAGITFIIINKSAGNIYVQTTSSQKINGQSSKTIGTKAKYVFVSDGVDWY